MSDRIILSCEHGGNSIPARWAPLFRRGRAALRSHRGWDPGALAVARRFAARLGAPLHYATASRLLVELNRSPHHPRLFSEFTRGLDDAERDRILREHYEPYRAELLGAIGRAIARGARVLHLSFHSFVPVLRGQVRTADIGLLYDPARPGERRLCARWKRALAEVDPRWRVRRNYPYRGTADGLPPVLRKRFGDRAYRGVEIEINQRLLRGADPAAHAAVRALEAGLLRVLGSAAPRGRGHRGRNS